MLYSIDLYTDFINVEGVAVASVLAPQTAGINRSEFDTLESDRLSGYSDAAFGEEIFDITATQVEAIVEPDRVGNDVGKESVAFVRIHARILAISTS